MYLKVKEYRFKYGFLEVLPILHLIKCRIMLLLQLVLPNDHRYAETAVT